MHLRYDRLPGLAAGALALALIFASTSAFAGGVNLSWNDCGTAGSANRSFACDTNAGFDALYVSAVPIQPMTNLEGARFYILVQVATDSPNWWGSSCTSTRYGVNVDFVGGPSSCLDPWVGTALGGAGAQPLYSGSAIYQRITGVIAVPDPVPTLLNTTDELYIGALRIGHGKTIGTGSCPDCLRGTCLVLEKVILYRYEDSGTVVDQEITEPLTRRYVTWQGASTFPGSCPGATPARTPSWGSVKSMYR